MENYSFYMSLPWQMAPNQLEELAQKTMQTHLSVYKDISQLNTRYIVFPNSLKSHATH